jgi:hypothetical protein
LLVRLRKPTDFRYNILDNPCINFCLRFCFISIFLKHEFIWLERRKLLNIT